MRNPQTLPDSPATQPYNQGPKPMSMQQQPMGYPGAGDFQVTMSPSNGFNQPTQQPMLQSPAPASPSPNYTNKEQPNVSPQSQPVTPTSLYGQGPGMNQSFGMQQQQQQQPLTPPGQNTMSWQAAPANVTPNSSAGTESPKSNSVADSDEGFGDYFCGAFGDFFGGAPMGGTIGADDSADLRGSPPPTRPPPPSCPPPAAPTASTDSQTQGIVQGMNSLTVRPGQSQQPYQNYSAQPFQTQQSSYTGSDYQAQGAPYAAADPWGSAAPTQPWQQQANANKPYGYQQQYQPNPGMNSFGQSYPQPQQQQYQTNAGSWSGDSFSGRANQHQLPNLNHAAPHHQGAPYGAYQQGQPVAYENADIDQDDGEDSFNGKACADYKSSTDVMREYGAGLRALRLLDETTKNYVEDEDCPHTGGGLRQAVKHEKAKYKQAKQIRKLKKLEYKNKKSEMLAESSRTVTSVRKGYDPELTSDKCQLDFDRQREAQIKALKLMSSMF